MLEPCLDGSVSDKEWVFFFTFSSKEFQMRFSLVFRIILNIFLFEISLRGSKLELSL